MQSANGDRYRAIPLRHFPWGRQGELVHDLSGGAPRVLPPDVARILDGYRPFATIPEHIHRTVAALGLDPANRPQLKWLFKDFLASVVLISEKTLLDSLRSEAHDPSPRISTVGIATRNRSQSLQRCLESFTARC